MSKNNSDGDDSGEYEDEYGGQNGNGDEDCSGDDSVEYEDEHERNEDDRCEDEHEGNGDDDGDGDDSSEYEDEYGGQNGNGVEDCSGDDSVEYEDEHEVNGDKDGGGDDSGEYGDPSGDGDGDGRYKDKRLNMESRKREPRREARTCQVFGAFANNSGGYHKIGFRRKDLYNQVGKQRRQQSSDASASLKFLKDVGSKDPLMFVKHTVDNEGRLQHLFWCDGESRLNYRVFVFATALVSKENEETYVWLLEQFMEAMEGKMPISVITDGDLAMKNAIRRVFPRAHRRLCAWHLLRNAISNV
ncbi:protein FAR1-RELATED SEQUENCE 5-like, partial [Trifolium medium]|nr:protein FAR1-RELATED SEQUENCE 5-like [Trifolium medium]